MVYLCQIEIEYQVGFIIFYKYLVGSFRAGQSTPGAAWQGHVCLFTYYKVTLSTVLNTHLLYYRLQYQ